MKLFKISLRHHKLPVFVVAENIGKAEQLILSTGDPHSVYDDLHIEAVERLADSEDEMRLLIQTHY